MLLFSQMRRPFLDQEPARPHRISDGCLGLGKGCNYWAASWLVASVRLPTELREKLESLEPVRDRNPRINPSIDGGVSN